MKNIILRYRKSINPPYTQSDFITIVGTFAVLFLILATALVVRNLQQSQRTQSHASTSVLTMLDNTKEINYYPANAGWTYMWSKFNPTIIDSDFAKIQGLGYNTVRIILQATSGAFDYPAPTASELTQLSQVITLAANHNLKVHLTLFDWWGAYTDLTGSKQWANAIIKPYTADPRVSIIELQNEIDPSNTSAMTWAQTMIPYLKSIDGGIPVTISEYGQSRMQALYTALQTTPPDFWDYHIYGDGEGTFYSLNQIKTLVSGQPLFIGETGYSTYPQNGGTPYDLAQNQLSQESYQEYYYRTLFAATNGLSLPAASPWIYSDFGSGAVPPNGTTDPAESYFGLYRTDGSAKPVVATMTSLLAGNPVDLSFNNSFENSDGNGLPTLWRIYQNASLGFTANFSRDATVAHTGNASVKISNSSNNTAGTASFFLNPVQYILPGQTYTFSAWVKGLNATGQNALSVAWFDSNNNYLSQNFSDNLPLGTTSWQLLSLNVTVPSNATTAELHLNSANNTGSVWFDDVSFTQTGVTPTPTLNPTATPTLMISQTPSNTPIPTPTAIVVTPTPTSSITDTTPPTVSITSPLNGTTVRHGSTITIAANATDNVGVSKVVFYENNTLLTTDTSAPYAISWSVPGKPNVSYLLKAVAFDAAGNTSLNVVSVTSK